MMPPACIAQSIAMAGDAPPVLAMGAWFKNTVCLARGGEAYITACAGDLDDAAACEKHMSMARDVLDWLDGPPALIAHDMHPDFLSTRHAVSLAARLQVPTLPVQHHHAHIAAICAEHEVAEPVLGLALDGIGLGSDGSAWGGELLRVDGAAFERLGHLRPLSLPGGDRAAREPWRMAAAVLSELGRGDEIARRFNAQAGAMQMAVVLERGFNCPQTSSMGRWFDAAAAMLGLCPVMEHEAQAAKTLEQAATGHVLRAGLPAPLSGGWCIGDDGVLDLLPLLAALSGVRDAGAGAALFHATLVAALAEWTLRAADASGIGLVAFGGGCFFNRLLSNGLRESLGVYGLAVLEARQQLPGDTAIALGQAWIGRHGMAG